MVTLLLCALFLWGLAPINTVQVSIEPSLCEVWGPGLYPDKITLPARYFYIQAVDKHKNKLTESPGNVFDVQMTGDSIYKSYRVWINILDRKNGSLIVRYKTYHTYNNFKIIITYKGEHVGNSPYNIKGTVYADGCYCPVKSFTKWLTDFGCEISYDQINSDLEAFPKVNFTEVRNAALKKFNHPGSMSICNYVIKDNQVYRKCYGQYVGFKMFLDAILLSLARKVHLPDMEMLFNLGDWPLSINGSDPKIPLFSWCGSVGNLDIVMPTYDITEASLECMGRVMLDMLSVQGNIDKKWEKKN
ncbi:hypothetical protein L9F63_026113 [Diploptera punctata]|uniref:Glycosyl transferase CAP10 domain-containing protein n=1 Tax=Diploptera punctata TaxID=6984 RepID=A0AAD8E1T2_DIPPU|nr:hypothetical protein L9F63_026113 [Diploptera punctata]